MVRRLALFAEAQVDFAVSECRTMGEVAGLAATLNGSHIPLQQNAGTPAIGFGGRLG